MIWKELTRQEKFERIIAGIIFLCCIGFIVFMLAGCTMSKPKESDLPASMSNMEKRDMLKYLNCMYAQQFNKSIDLKCNELQNQMSKNSMILDYAELKKDEKLPKLYNQKGESDMTFDDYFKYVK
jgi:hypothetical protein